MYKLIEKLYNLRDKLWFEGGPSSEPSKLYSNIDNDDFDEITRLVDDMFEEGEIRAYETAGDLLNAILQDYELEKSKNEEK